MFTPSKIELFELPSLKLFLLRWKVKVDGVFIRVVRFVLRFPNFTSHTHTQREGDLLSAISTFTFCMEFVSWANVLCKHFCLSSQSGMKFLLSEIRKFNLKPRIFEFTIAAKWPFDCVQLLSFLNWATRYKNNKFCFTSIEIFDACSLKFFVFVSFFLPLLNIF